ncbi:hypothetical protein O181_012844 [Austropuccinia psidii MF-1]|uniref:Uncharacterized protein n=1 Tax=Austropuccinia psidii MF-1 TaxID=1389203 RepID=A0A9Q3BVB3_9BASI|nr:hypothetical protein [Austropuccinia psidii MF-1]
MANVTPDSQLLSYECLHRLLSGNQEEHKDIDSVKVSPNLTKENMEQSMGGPNFVQTDLEASPSQPSTQRCKRCTSEEALWH